MDALSLLRLQIAWGADEALAPEPISRLLSRPADRPASRLDEPAASAPHRPPPIAPAIAAPAGAATPAAIAPAPGPAQPRQSHAIRPSRPASSTDSGAVRGPAQEARAAADAAYDLDGLRAAIAGFAHCGLRDTATHPVLPTGDPAGVILIVGEVPDEDEDRAGHPFAGRAGDLLDRMLASIGLHRDRMLLMPLIPWRPPGGRAPNPIEMTTCLPFLERACGLAQPRFILCMGSRPARVVADSVIRAGAGWRKPVIPGLGDGTRVLPMRHPSYLLSHLPARREAWGDLIRLRRALDEPSMANDKPGGSITDA